MKDRINSIDILRGIIILLMMFVNDLASVSNVPKCLSHAPLETNWMTIPDVVFPAFLSEPIKDRVLIPISIFKIKKSPESL